MTRNVLSALEEFNLVRLWQRNGIRYRSLLIRVSFVCEQFLNKYQAVK
jgi:hypothetical protein